MNARELIRRLRSLTEDQQDGDVCVEHEEVVFDVIGLQPCVDEDGDPIITLEVEW